MYEDTGVRLVVLGLNEARRQISSFDSALNELGRTIRTLDSNTATFSQKLYAVGDSFTTLGRQLTTSVTIPIVAAGGALLSFGINFEDAFAGVSKTVDGVALGFDELAISMYGTADGLTAAQKEAVFANESFGQLTDFGKDLRQEFIDLSTVIPIASTELAKIGQVAGQLGVDKEQIAGFTEIVALLAETTSLASEDAAFAIARIGNIMGVSSDQMAQFASQMGNAIVELGNNAAATETEIVNLAMRIAGAARAVGMSTPDVLGLSAALAAAGVRAEMGGSAVSRILTQMSYAANEFNMSQEQFQAKQMDMMDNLDRMRQFIEDGLAKGIDPRVTAALIEQQTGMSLSITGLEGDLKALAGGFTTVDAIIQKTNVNTVANMNAGFNESRKIIAMTAEVIGMTTDQLVALIKTDPTKAFQLFIGGLAKLQAEGKLTSEQLNALEINTIRLKDVINRLGPNVGLISDLVGMSNEEWVKQVALQEEAAKKFATTKNQLKLLYNEIKAFGTELFIQLSGPINLTIKSLKEFVSQLRELPPAAKVTIATFAGIAAAVGPLLIVLGTLIKLTASSIDGLKMLSFLKMPSLLGILTGGLLGGGGTKVAEEAVKKGFSLPGILTRLFSSQKAAATAIAGLSFSKIFSDGFRAVEKDFEKISPVSMKGFDPFGSIKSGILAFPKLVVNTFDSVWGFFTNKLPVKLGASLDVAKKFFESSIGGIFKSISSIFTGTFKAITGTVKEITSLGGLIFNVITAPLKILGSLVTNVIVPAFVKFASVAVNVFSTVGKAIFGLIFNTIPSLIGTLLGTIGSLLTAGIPLILGGLAVVIGPDLIKAITKNWDAVKTTLSASVKQFSEDVKNEGVFDAILLFMSGGSGGSGRTESMYGLAKAMGATEETARKFGWTLGEITIIIKDIVKTFYELIFGVDETDKAFGKNNDTMSRTADIILGILGAIRDFLGGFLVGFRSKFDGMRESFGGLKDALKGLRDAAKEFFAVIFGETDDATKTGDVYANATETNAGKVGQTAGEILGELITLGTQTLTLVINLAAEITKALTNLAKAYKENGIRGIFDELLVVIGDVWNSLKEDLVKIVQPRIESLAGWLSTEGVSKLTKAGADIAVGFGSMLGMLWEGWDITKLASPVDRKTMAYFDKTGKLVGEAYYEDYIKAVETAARTGTPTPLKFINDPELFFTDEGFKNANFIESFTQESETEQHRFKGLEQTFTDLFDSIKTLVTSDDTKTKVDSAFTTVLEWIKEKLDLAWTNYVSPTLTSLWESFKGWFDKTVLPDINEAGTRLALNLLLGFIKYIPAGPLGSLGFGWALDLVKGMEDGLGENAPTAEKFSGIVLPYETYIKILDIFNVDGETAGKQFDTGLTNGLDMGKIQAGIIAGGVATSAINKFKEIFGITGTQPSTVAQEMGTGITTGLNNGLVAGQETPVATVKAMSERMLSSSKTVLKESSPSQAFYRVGFDAMMGMNNGLITGGNSVLTSAAVISSSLISTFSGMQSSIGTNLDIARNRLNAFALSIPGIVSSITSQVSNAVSSAMSFISSSSPAVLPYGSKVISSKTYSYSNTSSQNNFAPVINGNVPNSQVESLYKSWIRKS